MNVMHYTLFIVFCIFSYHLLSAADVKKTEKCGDNKKGMCEAGFYGWCYFDTNGTYNCDEDNYCANRQSLRGKIVGACFDDDTRCCCNKGDYCNINFVKKNQEAMPWAHTCTAALAEPNTELQWKDCSDTYCYTLAYQDLATEMKYLIQGCHYQMHSFAETWKKEGERRGFVLSAIAGKFSCHDIVDKGKECVKTKTMQKGKVFEGTLCCCGAGVTGNKTKCNDEYINPIRREEALALTGDAFNSGPSTFTNTGTTFATAISISIAIVTSLF